MRFSRVDKMQLEMALNVLRQFDQEIVWELAIDPEPVATLCRVENALCKILKRKGAADKAAQETERR